LVLYYNYQVYILGRTGRAGRPGKAVTFYTELDFPYLRAIANVMKTSGCTDIPDWIFQSLKAPSRKMKKKLVKKPVQRQAPGEKSDPWTMKMKER
jgi:ATP-dependent RNA helicase DDX52/ROK1